MVGEHDIKTFETMILLTDELTKDRYEEASVYYKRLIKDLPAKNIKTEKLGKKKLSYAIRGRCEGYYLYFTYQSTGSIVTTKLDSALRKDDNVLKFVTALSSKLSYIPDPDEQPDQKIKKPVDIFNLIFEIDD